MTKEENISNLLEEGLSTQKLKISDDVLRIIIITATTFLVTQKNVNYEFVFNSIKDILTTVLRITITNSVDFTDTDYWIKRIVETINDDK